MRSVRHARTLLVAVVALGCVVVPQAAQAGSNGQQIVVNSYGCWYSRLYGNSHTGAAADTGEFFLDHYGANPYPNWWWKGTVHVYCWDYWHNYRGLVHTEVPASQPSNWWTVAIEPDATETDTSGLSADPLGGDTDRTFTFS